MFDTNAFKKSVKVWIKDNPYGTDQELIDFCDEKIPSSHYASSHWLIEQTVSWYRHVLAQREATDDSYGDDQDVA